MNGLVTVSECFWNLVKCEFFGKFTIVENSFGKVQKSKSRTVFSLTEKKTEFNKGCGLRHKNKFDLLHPGA